MNRRNFISSLAAAVAGIGTFNILPGAGRVWRAEAKRGLWFAEFTMGCSQMLNIQHLPKCDLLIDSEQMAAHMAEGLNILPTATFLPNLGETRRYHKDFIIPIIAIKPIV